MENAAKGQGLSPEQLKQMQEQQAKAAKETNTVKSLNEKLNAAKTAADAGDFDTAIASLTEATQMDATRDLLWFKLGDYYRLSAPKQTDPAEKQKRLAFGRRGLSESDRPQEGCHQRQGSQRRPRILRLTTTIWRKPTAKANKVDDAVKTYELAAQADPTTVAQYVLQYGRGAHQCGQGRRGHRRLRQSALPPIPTAPTPTIGRA